MYVMAAVNAALAAPVRRQVALMLFPSQRARRMAAWRSAERRFIVTTKIVKCYQESSNEANNFTRVA